MERIEHPAEVYWKDKTGKLFSTQEACEKYERLYDKWFKTTNHREFEGIEGELCHAYWTETKEDVEEVLWLEHYTYHPTTHNCIKDFYSNKDYKPQWIILQPDYDEYGAITAVRSIEEVKDLVQETLRAAQDVYSELVKISWEKV